MRRSLLLPIALVFLAMSCGQPAPLDEQTAIDLIRRNAIDDEPIYAEVPQRVWWGPGYPKDDYDDRALATLRNLERAGLLTVSYTKDKDGRETYRGKVTEKGFAILGTVPSARGKAFRGKICVKKIDRIANFIRHPSDPLVGSAEIIWHYTKPTPLYELFTTKIDKPLDRPYRSVASIRNEKGLWRVELAIRKTEVVSEKVPAAAASEPAASSTETTAAQPPR
ncbi:MAG: hypothetical protein NDJ92_12910 [Thermoanaerobaculia bacterium]|nr:hypothetical protein [Thermoanaerobaculia bacterium]